MTTKVTVEPAGHNIKVQMADGPIDDQTVTTEHLKIGDPAKDYWIYGDKVLTISEETSS